MQFAEAVPPPSESAVFDVHRSWLSLRQACSGHKLLIAATCVFTLGLLVAYIVLWPPIYSAQVELVSESDKDLQREAFYQTWAVFRKDRLNDEIQLLSSTPVLGKVVDQLGLTYNDVYHPFMSQAIYLWTTSLPGRLYRRFKAWIWPVGHGPYDPTPAQIDRAKTLTDFKSGVAFDPVSETDVGSLVVRGPSPRVAQMANAIVQVYFDLRRHWHVQEAEDAYRALEVEQSRVSDKLRELESKMAQYYTRNEMLLSTEKDKLDLTGWSVLKASILDLQSTIASQEHSVREIDDQLAQEPKSIVSATVTAPNPVAQSLIDRLVKLQVSRKETLTHFRPDAPEVADIDRQIAIIKGQLTQEPQLTEQQRTTVVNDTYETMRRRKAALDAELQGERAALEVKQSAASQMQAMVTEIPEKMKVQHQLEREHAGLEKEYSLLNEKLMIAAVSRATARSAPMSIRVVEPAQPPSDARWPRTKLLLAAGLAFGLVAGVLLALLVDLIYGRVTRYMLATGGRALPVYAIVGRDRQFGARLLRRPPSGTLPGGGTPLPIGQRAEVAD